MKGEWVEVNSGTKMKNERGNFPEINLSCIPKFHKLEIKLNFPCKFQTPLQATFITVNFPTHVKL